MRASIIKLQLKITCVEVILHYPKNASRNSTHTKH